jgi:hypothetical protein
MVQLPTGRVGPGRSQRTASVAAEESDWGDAAMDKVRSLDVEKLPTGEENPDGAARLVVSSVEDEAEVGLAVRNEDDAG